MFTPLRYLVISLGNPAPYLDTVHSAGHFVLSRLPGLIGPSQPSFSSQRLGKKSTQVSTGDKYILAKSPAVMNVSGPWVAHAWKETLASTGLTPAELGLVIVNDDLELDLGAVKRRAWKSSHKGHNGLKSIGASLRQDTYRDSRWERLSVGVGRPIGRDQSTVSDYVLAPLSQKQRVALAEEAVPRVLEELERLTS
jgi:peptidyl-tRNA hydrolase, PTH1 family